jgi:hypothetical protein
MSFQKRQRVRKLVTGYRPEMRARRMAGMRQPLDGPIFENLEDAQDWCIHAMICHHDRRLGMSDATIEPFKGMVDCGGPPSTRICEEAARSESRRLIGPSDRWAHNPLSWQLVRRSAPLENVTKLSFHHSFIALAFSVLNAPSLE